jgi:hypothetical protein
MAQANRSSNKSSRSSAARTKPKSTAAARSTSSARDTSAARSKPKAAGAARRSSSARSSGNASRSASAATPSSDGMVPKVAVVTGIATAAAGLVGGVVLGRSMRSKPKRVLGMKIPGTGGAGLDGVAKQVKKTGKQLQKTGKQVAELTDEVRTARKKAEDVGKAIS